MLSIPIIIPASLVSNPVFAPAIIIASVALPEILTLFVVPTSMEDDAPNSFILPPPRDIDASVEDISMLEAEISNSLVDILISVPSNLAKLSDPSPT